MKLLVLVSLFSMLQVLNSFSLCPQGWFEFKDDCYVINATYNTLPGSRQFCRSFGDSSKLLTIKSDEQEKFIIDFVQKHISTHEEAKIWTNAVGKSSHYEWPENHQVVTNIEPTNHCKDECCGLQVNLNGKTILLNESPCEEKASIICVKPQPHANWTSVEYVGKKINSLLSKHLSILSSIETSSASSFFLLGNKIDEMKSIFGIHLQDIDKYFNKEANAVYNLSILLQEMKEEQSIREDQTEIVKQIQVTLSSLHKKVLYLENSFTNSRIYFDGKVDLVLDMQRESKKILSEFINSKFNGITTSHSLQQKTFYHGNQCNNNTSMMIIVIFCFFFTFSSLTINVLLLKQISHMKNFICYTRRPILGFNHETTNDQLEMRGREI